LYNVADLISHNIQDCIPSIELNVYSTEDVQKLNSSLPEVHAVKDIMKVHEVLYQFKEGQLTTYVKDVSVGKPREITLLTSSGKSNVADELSESEEELDGITCILFNFSFYSQSKVSTRFNSTSIFL